MYTVYICIRVHACIRACVYACMALKLEVMYFDASKNSDLAAISKFIW